MKKRGRRNQEQKSQNGFQFLKSQRERFLPLPARMMMKKDGAQLKTTRKKWHRWYQISKKNNNNSNSSIFG